MSDRLRRQVAIELEQLRTLLQVHEPLLRKVELVAPDAIELSALGAMLHGLYTGIENILKRIAVEVDGSLPRGVSWHRELLDSMREPAAARPAAISRALRNRLRPYLDFRHFFRNAYAFQLRWDKMAGLVRDCEVVLRDVEAELQAFAASLRGEQESGMDQDRK